MKRVLCFGIAVFDRIYEVETLPTGDEKYTATGYRESGGGVAATAAVAVARLGGHAAFMGALGDDPAGRWLAAEMSALGVALDVVQYVAHGRTPNACALVAPDGGRCLIIDRGTARPASAAPDSACANVDALLVDHRFPDLAAALLIGAPRTMPRILDAEGGDPEALRHLVALAQYPIFSSTGLRLCTGQDDPLAALSRVSAPQARCLAVTRGAAGSLWLIDGQVHHVAAPPVAARDTTGCGDVFHGAVALALAEGQHLLDAARFATAAAALKALNGDGWRGMPDRQAVQALLKESW
ncbi:MAG TPA: PfkB family carbohydrate kinase [Acetobacteraceae bacterium]|nr:PfkB family carbohydrate kinase [Acetobacteraceae bacterium]